MVVHETFKTEGGDWVFPVDAVLRDGKWFHAKTGEELQPGALKDIYMQAMSDGKSSIKDQDIEVKYK